MNERIEPNFSQPALRDETLAGIVPSDAPNAPTPEEVLALRERAARKLATAQAMRKTVWGWMTRHERPLSALSMIGGFAFDNYAYRRIDLPNTQALFVGYLAVSGVAIVLLHLFETRARAGHAMPKWHAFLPMATQFTLGALWSAFLVFYARGAVLEVSWPYLALLAVILIGNEVFKKYHTQLVFTAILYFFALYSYAIVTMPMLTRSIAAPTFVLSGVIALFVFAIFLRIIKAVGRDQWSAARWQIAGGALVVFGTMNAFYFTRSLPPLPLVLADSGIYHAVEKTGDVYQAQGEMQPWLTGFGAPPVMHVVPGQPLYVYNAVFAPIRFHTTIVDHWKHYNRIRHKWQTVSRVSFNINGGRDGGYRGYTIQHKIWDGEWRVDVDTADGRIIGRIRFTVRMVPQSLVPTSVTLR